MSEHVIRVPEIQAVAITPNPAAPLQGIRVVVQVSERERVLEIQKIYAGEMISGEEVYY